MANFMTAAQALAGLKIGTDNVVRPANDGESLTVTWEKLDPRDETFEGKPSWSALVAKLQPVDKRVMPIHIRYYIENGSLGEDFNDIMNRASNFAFEKYGVTNFGPEALIGMEIRIVHHRKVNAKTSTITLVQIVSLPYFEKLQMADNALSDSMPVAEIGSGALNDFEPSRDDVEMFD